MRLDFGFFNWQLVQSFILKGLIFSVELTLVAMIGGIALGTILALMRLSGRPGLRARACLLRATVFALAGNALLPQQHRGPILPSSPSPAEQSMKHPPSILAPPVTAIAALPPLTPPQPPGGTRRRRPRAGRGGPPGHPAS